MYICRSCKKEMKCKCKEQKSAGPCSICGELSICTDCRCGATTNIEEKLENVAFNDWNKIM